MSITFIPGLINCRTDATTSLCTVAASLTKVKFIFYDLEKKEMYLEILTISSILYSIVNGFWRFVGEILSSYLWISYSFYETDDLMEELYAIFVEKFKAYRYQSAYPSLDYISGWCIHCGIPLHVSLTHNKEMDTDILTISTCRIFGHTFEKFINGFMHKCKDFKTQKKYINRFNYWTSFGKVCRTFNTIFINKNLKHKLISDID